MSANNWPYAVSCAVISLVILAAGCGTSNTSFVAAPNVAPPAAPAVEHESVPDKQFVYFVDRDRDIFGFELDAGGILHPVPGSPLPQSPFTGIVPGPGGNSLISSHYISGFPPEFRRLSVDRKGEIESQNAIELLDPYPSFFSGVNRNVTYAWFYNNKEPYIAVFEEKDGMIRESSGARFYLHPESPEQCGCVFGGYQWIGISSDGTLLMRADYGERNIALSYIVSLRTDASGNILSAVQEPADPEIVRLGVRGMNTAVGANQLVAQITDGWDSWLSLQEVSDGQVHEWAKLAQGEEHRPLAVHPKLPIAYLMNYEDQPRIEVLQFANRNLSFETTEFTFPANLQITNAKFSADAKYLLVTTPNELRVYSVAEDGRLTQVSQANPVTQISYEGLILLTKSQDQ